MARIILRVILCLSIIITISSTEIYSQERERTISGFVRDISSGEPLIGVSVTLSGGVETTTNSDGFYSISGSAKETTILFKHIGYADIDKSIVVASDTTLNIDMYHIFVEIDEVVVSLSAPKPMAKIRDNGVVAIDASQLKYVPSFFGEQDIFKYFQLLPGVVPGKEGTSGLNIRGGSSDQTLILMDDVPIYNHSHAFGFVSIFNGETIKYAELYKGYIPPEYGGRLSGVATLNMREGNKNEHKQTIQLGTTTASGIIEGPINGGKGSYLVGARYFVPNMFMHLYKYINNSKEEEWYNIGFYDINAKINYNIRNHKLSLNLYSGNDVMEIGSDFKYDIYSGGNVSKLNTESISKLNWGSVAGSLKLNSILSNRSSFSAMAYVSLLHNNNSYTFDDNVEGSYIHSSITSQLEEYGLKLNLNHNLVSWYNLSYGAKLSFQNFNPQTTTIKRNDQHNFVNYGSRELLTASTYIDNRLAFNNLIINIGARLSIYNSNDVSLVIEPRVAINYSLGDNYIWAGYAQSSQPLFSMYQYHNTLPIDYWLPFQNSSELPIANQFTLGYKRRVNNNFEVSIEGYYKRFNNLSIIYDIDDYLLQNGGYNLASGIAYGLEFLAQYSKGKFNFMGAYTYSKSVHDIAGKEVDFIFDTPHNLNLFGSYNILKKGKRSHTLSLNINYKSGTPYYVTTSEFEVDNIYRDMWWVHGNIPSNNVVENNPIYPNTRLSDYFRVDINYSMEKRLKKGSRIWQLSLLNATAHRNAHYIYYDTTRSKHYAFQLIPFLPSFSYIRRF